MAVTPTQVSEAFALVAKETSVAAANLRLGTELAPLFNAGGGGGGAVEQVVASLPLVVTPSTGVGIVTVSHASSGVVAATYGDATHYPVVVVDAFGHVTSVSVLPTPVVPVASSAPALALGVAASGAATTWSRADHVHPMPTAAQVGAEPTIATGASSQYLRGDKSWQTLNTTAVAEGTNLYYTDARARAAISASAPLSYNSSTGTLTHLAGDGQLHVPATSTTSNLKFLQAGAIAGALSWVSITPASIGAASASDLSGYLPLTAGASKALTGYLYGTRAIFTTTADAPISITHNLAGAYTHPFQAFNSGMVAGNQYNFDFGQSASTNNAANFGFKYVGAGSSSNYVTLGMYGANDLMTITAAGVPKFSGLATAGFVRANASGQLSSSALVAADIPALDASKITTGTFADARISSAATWNTKLSTVTADATSRAANTFYAAPNGAAGAATFRAIVAADIPTLNQNTTGSAATLTNPRTLTIGSTGKTFNGSTNVSWSLAEIGALAVGGTAANSSALGGAGSDYFVQGNGTGVLGHRTTNLGTATTIPATQSGFYDYLHATDGPQGAVWTHMIRSAHSGNATSNQWMFDVAATFGPGTTGGVEGYYVRTISSGSTPGWRQLWHSGNLTNLNQLTNGPGYITSAGSISGNAATATEAANSTNLGGKNWDYFVQGNGTGPYGHRTAEVSSFNTLLPSGFYDNRNGISPLTTGWTHMIRSAHSDPSSGSATWSFDIAANFYTPANGQQEGYYVRVNEGSSWGTWRALWHSGNLTSATLPGGPYLPLTGNAATATKWATPRTITIGSTGKTLDGTVNVSWSLAEIGAQAAGSYLPVNNPAFAGVLTGPVSNVGGMVAKTYSADANYFTILGDGAAAADYTLTSSRNGAETYVGASTRVSLALSGAEKLYITSAGVTIPTLTGSTTRIATINAAGQVGATTWANDGPWLPLTGNKTLTGYLIMEADLYINSGWKVRGAGWYTNDFGLFATTGYTFDGSAGYAFASSASLNGSTFLNGQTFFHRINVTSTTYTLPAVAVGETILLTFDVASCAVTSSSSQSVTWRQASGVNATAAANTLFDSFGYGSGLRICSVWLTGISASRVDIRG